MLTNYNTAYDIVLDSLPDDPEIFNSAKAGLVFRPQHWVNECARDVREQEKRFTIPLADLYDFDAGDYHRIHKSAGGHYVSDQLKSHENAPELARVWDGPFEINIIGWEA